MKTKLNFRDKEYRIRMGYFMYPFGVPALVNAGEGKKLPLIKAETECAILDDDDKAVAIGLAKCSIHDQYNKKKGRAMAFQRALVKLGADKKERTEIFDKVYFERSVQHGKI